MKTFVYIFVALFACAAAYDVEVLGENEWNKHFEQPDTQGLILNAQGKKALNNFIRQMPCGYPDHGIPPLAPYTNAEKEIHLGRSVVDSFMQFLRFRLDGLEETEIKQLKISYTFSKKVKFHFHLKQLKASAHVLNTNTLIDVLESMGLSVRYEGGGPMAFTLENLTVQGQFKYKMPIMFGSIKIYKFECTVSLGGVQSNIGGVLGNGKFNQLVNDIISREVPAFINGNQQMISDKIEEIFVPFVNTKLKGHKIWYLFDVLAASTRSCEPTPAPWLAIEHH